MNASLCLVSCSDIAASMEEKYLGLLSNSERRRYDRFLRPQRRRQFLAGRVLLRHMLSMEFGRPVDTWRFEERAGLPPRLLTELPNPAACSLAHSRDFAICLLTPEGSVGVDIEYLDADRDFLAIATHFYSAAHARRLAALPLDEQRILFYRYWTLNEAVAKMGPCGDTGWASRQEGSAPNRDLVVVTTILRNYGIAAAIHGDFTVPSTIGLLRPDGLVEPGPYCTWQRHGEEEVGAVGFKLSRANQW